MPFDEDAIDGPKTTRRQSDPQLAIMEARYQLELLSILESQRRWSKWTGVIWAACLAAGVMVFVYIADREGLFAATLEMDFPGMSALLMTVMTIVGFLIGAMNFVSSRNFVTSEMLRLEKARLSAAISRVETVDRHLDGADFATTMHRDGPAR